MKVGVIDYGVGNLGSVIRVLESLRVAPVLVTSPIDLPGCDRLILPGVGNFSDCARLLASGGWTSGLREVVKENERPILGICVGMQLLAETSTEGSDDSLNKPAGLGLIPGSVEHLTTLGCDLKVPHVGWNGVTALHTESSDLFRGIPDGTDFYFVHSYAFIPAESQHVIATVDYGIPVTAAVRSGHVWGTQFHPEKSSRAGFQLLRNFIES